MQKRVGAVEEFLIETLREGQSLHVALAVSGWVEAEGAGAFTLPWRHLDVSREQYSLRFESRYLLELGKALDYFMGIALSYAVQQTLMETALASHSLPLYSWSPTSSGILSQVSRLFEQPRVEGAVALWGKEIGKEQSVLKCTTKSPSKCVFSGDCPFNWTACLYVGTQRQVRGGGYFFK